jgi:hypothetical protein
MIHHLQFLAPEIPEARVKNLLALPVTGAQG